MSGSELVQGIAVRLIRASCRRLPEEERAEHCREWSAELPAILEDSSVRLPILRAVRAFRYSAGISRTTRYLRRTAAGAPAARSSSWRDGAPVRQAAPAFRLTAGVAIWLVVVFAVVEFLRAFPHPRSWQVVLIVALAAASDVFCLADIVRADRVRYLPKWAWALICLVQWPSGGLAYLFIGRVSGVRSSPPSSPQRP